jgi:hypothetical protein
MSHFLFNQGIFDQKRHDHRPLTHPTFLFRHLKIKLKVTLTEHNFQVAFKEWLKSWKFWIHAEEDYLEGDDQ